LSAAANTPRDGTVRIMRDKKGRGGKTVTLVVGVPGSEAVLTQLTRDLKQQCGTGGTLRGDVIEIQGDFRTRLQELLVKRGYAVKLAGG
jgi:translation initiation factor 1